MDSFDIYIADVYFTKDDGEIICKARPVMVREDGVYMITISEITSHAPRDNNDYLIQDWREAGLEVPSVLRLGYKFKISKYLIYDRIGRFTLRDIKNISHKLEEME